LAPVESVRDLAPEGPEPTCFQVHPLCDELPEHAERKGLLLSTLGTSTTTHNRKLNVQLTNEVYSLLVDW
jgi:hypothetical protein